MKTSLTEFANKVRDAADIVEIIGSFVPLKRSGSGFKGLCPFHKEKTPSFHVHPGKQIFHCFGCGVGGDIVKFWMLHEKVNFRTALEQLGARLGLPLPKLIYQPKDEGLEKKRRDLFAVNEFAASWYHKLLLSNEAGEAREYLKERGVSKEVATEFQLGYASPGWEGLLESARKRGFSNELLNQAGLALPRKGGRGFYDRFRNRIIFPIYDLQGRCVAFGGRRLSQDPNEPKYINSPESEVYQKRNILYGLNLARQHLKGDDPALVVEGYMDLIALYRYGFPGGVATLGTALTDNQARLLKRFTREVIFLYDGDEAGQKAMLLGSEVLLGQSLAVKVVLLPNQEDPDTYLSKHGAEAFNELLRDRKDFLDFFLEVGRNKFNTNTPEGKIGVLDLLKPVMARVGHPIMFEDYTRRLAEGLRLDQHLIIRHLRARTKAARRSVGETISEQVSQNIPIIELGFLKLVLENPSLREHARKNLELEWFTSVRVRKCAETILFDEAAPDDYNALLEEATDEDGKFLREVTFFELTMNENESESDLLGMLLNRLRMAFEAQERHELVLETHKLDQNRENRTTSHEATLEEGAKGEDYRPLTDGIHHKTKKIWETRKSIFEKS